MQGTQTSGNKPLLAKKEAELDGCTQPCKKKVVDDQTFLPVTRRPAAAPALKPAPLAATTAGAAAKSAAGTAKRTKFKINVENTRSRYRCRLPDGKSVSFAWGDLEHKLVSECTYHMLFEHAAASYHL